MANEATHFTLEEFSEDKLAWPSLDMNDTLMTFPSFKDASDMAEWMLEAGTADGQLPIIGILAHIGNPTVTPCKECSAPVVWDENAKDYRHTETDGCALALSVEGYDPEGWSAGWTQYVDGVVSTHEGDYENDPDIWKTEEEKMQALSSDPKDTVREYAPDAVRAAAFRLGDANGTKTVGWLVRDDGTFEINARKRGGSTVTEIVDREGEVLQQDSVSAAIAQATNEIVRDVQNGEIPKTILGFSDLHDYCDANEYGGLTDKFGDMSTEDAAKVQDAVDDWIKRGGLINVKVTKREFLVHLNIQLTSGTVSLADVEREIKGALEVGLGSDTYAPHLHGAEIDIAVAEEI